MVDSSHWLKLAAQMLLRVAVIALEEGVELFEFVESKSEVASMSELRHPLMAASLSSVVRNVLHPCEILVGMPLAADCVVLYNESISSCQALLHVLGNHPRR